MEIERKYLIKKLPEDLAQYPHMEMEQAYLCTEPVVRVRKRRGGLCADLQVQRTDGAGRI